MRLGMSRFSKTPKKTANARRLRRNMTEVEKRLWHRLRDGQIQGIAFRRQHPLGRYIVDFCALSQRLIVELDGGQHAATSAKDASRTKWLMAQGFRVIRFWNSDIVENLEGVLRQIAERDS